MPTPSGNKTKSEKGMEGKIGAEGHYQATEEASHSVQTQILISQMEQPKHCVL